MAKLVDYVNLFRVRQWHKNAFVLLGFFALGDYSNYPLLINSLLIFMAFCLSSSSIYIMNDYFDIDEDRNHPAKKNRPLASGRVNVKAALFTSVILFLSGLAIAFYIDSPAAIILLLYFTNNFLYSYYLKKVPIIDIFLIGFGFMLRIFAGTSGIGIHISEWMIITGFMISLLIGFAKRYAEMTGNKDAVNQRHVLKEYSSELLRSFILIMASGTIITYSLYTLSPRSLELHGSSNLIYTIPFVIFGIFRFLYLVLHDQKGDDPSTQIFTDRQLVFTIILWAFLYGTIINLS
jgi:4-hydroxybenzoate polyprenyltransferase